MHVVVDVYVVFVCRASTKRIPSHTNTPGHLFCFARSLISWNVTLTITCNQIPQGDTNTCTNKGGGGGQTDRDRGGGNTVSTYFPLIKHS